MRSALVPDGAMILICLTTKSAAKAKAGGRKAMISRLKELICAVCAFAAMALATDRAAAQSGAPIKIGFSMAMTGGLAANGRSALLAQKIWEEDVNAKGGL